MVGELSQLTVDPPITYSKKSTSWLPTGKTSSFNGFCNLWDYIVSTIKSAMDSDNTSFYSIISEFLAKKCTKTHFFQFNKMHETISLDFSNRPKPSLKIPFASWVALHWELHVELIQLYGWILSWNSVTLTFHQLVKQVTPLLEI